MFGFAPEVASLHAGAPRAISGMGGIRVWGLGFKSLGFRVWGIGFRV